MTDLEFMPLVSEEAQNRYARALSEFKSAEMELFDAWQAVVREQYSREQGPPDREEDCSDMG
jgi:hypothetical protein